METLMLCDLKPGDAFVFGMIDMMPRLHDTNGTAKTRPAEPLTVYAVMWTRVLNDKARVMGIIKMGDTQVFECRSPWVYVKRL